MGIQVKYPILARIFNKIPLTLFALLVFACMLCSYFPDPLRFKRFPLTPSLHSKRKDLSIGDIGNGIGSQNCNCTALVQANRSRVRVVHTHP